MKERALFKSSAIKNKWRELPNILIHYTFTQYVHKVILLMKSYCFDFCLLLQQVSAFLCAFLLCFVTDHSSSSCPSCFLQ